MNISAVVVTYRRLAQMDQVLRAWLAVTPDVWLADCSGRFTTTLPVTLVTFKPDIGNRTRHALATMTEGDFVIKADDDVVPKPGLADDFLRNYEKIGGDGILGLIGRQFRGPVYYGQTRFFRASRLLEPLRVDFVGGCTFSPRKYLAFDLAGCLSPIEDLFWQMKAFPKAGKWVIPSLNYQNLPEPKTLGLCHDPKARLIREAFYNEYYMKFYAEKKE